MKETKISVPDDSAVDLVELLTTIWRRKWILFASVAGTLILAITYLHFATYTYTAELDVKPAQSSGNNPPRSSGGLSSLASLAGLSLPTDQSSTQFELYVEGLQSRAAADALSKDVNLMRVIFSSEWNEQTQTWEEPKSSIRPLIQAVKAVLGVPNYPYQPPDGGRLKIYMDARLKVNERPNKIIVTITFTHKDPQFAATFLAALDKLVDSKLRQDALFRSSTNVAYLSEKLKTVTVEEHRQAITQALIEEERNVMMANSNAPFAAEPFGGPTALFRPTDPDPWLTLASGALAGIVIGIAVALLVGRRRPRIRHPTPSLDFHGTEFR